MIPECEGSVGQGMEWAGGAGGRKFLGCEAEAGCVEKVHAFAAGFAPTLRLGDFVALHGDLGVGKTEFVRGLMQALSGSKEPVDVVSPTFPIVQFYDFPHLGVAHFDFYRIKDPSELEELGFDEARESRLVLAEWPENMGAFLPEDRLDIFIRTDRATQKRIFLLEGVGSWAWRLAHIQEILAFLEAAAWQEADRFPIRGDASTRRFERLVLNGKRAILMDSAQEPGACLSGKKQSGMETDRQTVDCHAAVASYAKSVHLAETVDAFIAVDRLLRGHGFAAPDILYADRQKALLLVEDFGNEGIVKWEEGKAVPLLDRYRVCIDVLVLMGKQNWTHSVRVESQFDYEIPVFDEGVLLTEAELMLDWFAPHFCSAPLEEKARKAFRDIWIALFSGLLEKPFCLTLRDFHSPNILWREGKEGVLQVGLIDFQDALLGHSAYDLVSLLQDARVDIPAEMEAALLATYNERSGKDARSGEEFRRVYAILGAQRCCKLLGGFMRLCHYYGKPGYLIHLPRVAAYLSRNIAMDESLKHLHAWFNMYLPVVFTPSALNFGGMKWDPSVPRQG